MSSGELLITTPVHEKSFDEFASSSLVACVRAGPGGTLSVVDVDIPGWSGLDKVRVEVAGMFSALGFSRTAASTLTNNFVRLGLDESFTEDCKCVPLDGPSTLIFVKEHAAKSISAKEILRRVHASAVANAMGSGMPMRAAATAGKEESAAC